MLKLGRQFACERICYDSPYFLDKVKGREVMHRFVEGLAATAAKDEEEALGTQLVFLDAEGRLIRVLEGSKSLKSKGPKFLLQAMKKALRENRKRTATP